MFYGYQNFSFTYVMNTVSVRMAPFHPQMVPFDVAAKRVVFGGPVFICRNVKEGAPGCIMFEVDTASVAELVLLTPCSGASGGTVTGGSTTSGSATVDAAWGSRGWTGCCNRLKDVSDPYNPQLM